MELQKVQTHQIVSSGVRKRKTIRRAKTELPEDIIKDEILTRLPTKCLVRFMLVHKSWKALFSNSEFVQSHLIQQQSYKDREHLIAENIMSRDRVCIISRSADAQAMRGPSRSDMLIGSINGLVCTASSGEKLCIWNPAIGQVMEIYRPCCHRYDCFTQHLFGFSWDHMRNDYKIVLVCHNVTTISRKLCIYSCNSSCWIEVVIPDSVVPQLDGSMLDCSYRGIIPCAIVKGVPYWSYVQYENSSPQQLCVFKFVAETNEFRSLPNLYSVGLQGKDFNFVNIRDRLSVLVYTTKQQYSLVDMYFLDEKSNSDGVWSKMYSTRPIGYVHDGSLHCFKKSGDILIDKFWGMYIYDTKAKEWKTIDRRHRIRGICYRYTPSLVCVEGMQFYAHTFLEI